MVSGNLILRDIYGSDHYGNLENTDLFSPKRYRSIGK